MNNYSKEQIKEAIKVATNQAECHAQQISGVWSISGKDFCDKYTFLNYDDAVEAQDEANREAFYDFVYERKAQYRNITGSEEIPVEVENQIWAKAESEFYFETESFVFWDDVRQQLQDFMDKNFEKDEMHEN